MLHTLLIKNNLGGFFNDSVPCLRFQRHFQVQSKIGRRQSLSPATTGCSQAASDQATTPRCRSSPLDSRLPLVFRMAAECDSCGCPSGRESHTTHSRAAATAGASEVVCASTILSVTTIDVEALSRVATCSRSSRHWLFSYIGNPELYINFIVCKSTLYHLLAAI